MQSNLNTINNFLSKGNQYKSSKIKVDLMFPACKAGRLLDEFSLFQCSEQCSDYPLQGKQVQQLRNKFLSFTFIDIADTSVYNCSGLLSHKILM